MLEQHFGNMTTSFLDGKKGRSLDNIIAKLSKVRSSRKGDRILLISEKNNACLSLSSDESEDGEADLHQCGSCKEMFTNLTLYISHKIQKPCRTGSASKNHQWSNEDMEMGDDEKDRGSFEKPSKLENDVAQDYQKKKHDRKGMARKLTMMESDNAALPDENIRVDDTENPVIVVVSEADSERRFMNEKVSAETSKEKGNDFSQTASRNMPYLERIPNYAFDSPTMYSHVGMPNFLPRISERTMPNHSSETEAENAYRERIGHKNYDRDSREPWSFSTKHGPPYRGPTELPRQYGSQVHPSMYKPPYNLSYPNPYNHFTTMHTSQAGKTCCSSAYSAQPHYPADLYTIPIDEYNKSLYGKGPSQQSYKTSTDQDGEKSSKARHERSSEPPANLDQQDEGQTLGKDVERRDNSEQNEYTKDPGKEPIDEEAKEGAAEIDETAPSTRLQEDSQVLNEGESVPHLIKGLSLNSKENNDSPLSSSRLELNELNSQQGSVRGSSPSHSESPLSSSNQSGEQIISPSQVYETGSFPSHDDDASKQSMEPDSPMCSISGADGDVASPKSKQISTDPALRGSENITPQDIRPSFIQNKRQNSADVSFERPADVYQGESSPPNDPSWRHSKQVYRCPLCAKIFPFKSKLQRHVLVHTGIKPYKCNVCGRGFTQQIDLQRHLTRHTGEKPFKCHLCKAQFIRADNLRKHAKDTHFVNIEEPIRKRRRKTTGSDTVLPPLEVAIAMAINETEKNGGRVLGRAGNRGNRTGRKERMSSADDEERRIEQSNETFARPTMGSVPSHQYPVGPPSMGFPPHGPALPPFQGIPSDIYEAGLHERGSPPPRLPHPPRYHPGSMVFQPRTDRFLERPYYSRPPGDVPSMYWASPPRHAMMGHKELSPHFQTRERFNSEASEGASSVFEGREEGIKHERLPPSSRNEEMFAVNSSDDLRREQLPMPYEGRPEPDRLGPATEGMQRIPDKNLPPSELFHRSSSGRFAYQSENRSPRMMDERPVHILDERGLFAQERLRSCEEKIRPQNDLTPNPHSPNQPAEERIPRESDEQPPLSGDERFNVSPQRAYATSNAERIPQQLGRFIESDERPVIHHEERIVPSMGFPFPAEGRSHLRVQDGWRGYEMINKGSPAKVSPTSSENFVKPKNESPTETTNGYRTQREEFTSASS